MNETIQPVGNEKVKGLTSRSMAQKRRLASRLGPLMGLKHDPIVVDVKKDGE